MPIPVKAELPPRRRTILSATVAACGVAIITGCAAKSDAPPTAYCAQAACALTLADGQTVVLSLAPRPLKPMQPITAHLRFTRPQRTEPMRLQIDGAEMDMGFNQANLRRQDDGTLAGEFVLPVCVSGRMRWRIDLRQGDAATPALARFLVDAPE